MAENKKPISLKEGKAYIDGVEVMEGISLSIVATPTVWTGKVLGDKSSNRRWLGIDYTGTIVEYKTTNRYLDMVKKYQKDGLTPELTIQGTRTDKDSDYYGLHGSESVTVTGCVITGDINLINIDSAGEVVQETINFGAKKVV